MDLSHVNQQGEANMVDVTDKAVTARQARAEAFVHMSSDCLQKIQQNDMQKGDVLSVARIAGIQAAKKCADLIPLCHPLALSKVQIEFQLQADKSQVRIEAMCKLKGQTGVEMEALTAASVAALTLFDMCKAVDPKMEIHGLKVMEKKGGKSADWKR